jgi:acyl carrier protein
MGNLSENLVFQEFVANELGINLLEFTLETKFRELTIWSSLNALYLMTRISEEVEVFISAAEIASCSTFSDIHHLIQEKINGNQ